MNSSAFSSSTESISSRMSSISSLSFSPRVVASAWPASSPVPPPPRFWFRFCSCSCGNALTPSTNGIASPTILWPHPPLPSERIGGSRSGLQGRDQLAGGLACLQQVLDVLAGPPQRFAHRDPLQDLAPGVEDDGVPARGGDRPRVPRGAPAPEVGPGVLGRVHHRPLHLGVGGQALDLPAIRQ